MWPSICHRERLAAAPLDSVERFTNECLGPRRAAECAPRIQCYSACQTVTGVVGLSIQVLRLNA